MVVVWILWRDVDDVVEQHEPYRKATPFWFWQKYNAPQGKEPPKQMSGYWLHPKPPATLCDVGIHDACPSLETRDLSAKKMTFEQAKADLWRKALDGLVTAEAVEIETNRRVDIPAREWHPMVYRCADQLKDTLALNTDRYGPRYSHIDFKVVEVLKQWPARTVRARTSSRQRAGFYEELRTVMEANREAPQRKGEWEVHAKTKHGISRAEFRKLWAYAAEEAKAPKWSLPGAGRNPATLNLAAK
jgi:hypothetical protein